MSVLIPEILGVFCSVKYQVILSEFLTWSNQLCGPCILVSLFIFYLLLIIFHDVFLSLISALFIRSVYPRVCLCLLVDGIPNENIVRHPVPAGGWAIPIAHDDGVWWLAERSSASGAVGKGVRSGSCCGADGKTGGAQDGD